MDSIILRKAATIERCLQRVQSAYAAPAVLPFEEDYDRQDVLVLNLLRACEAALDLANHVVLVRRLGLPATSRESFRLVADAGLISSDLSERLQRMVSFRNLVVHDYSSLNLAILRALVEHHLGDFEALRTPCSHTPDAYRLIQDHGDHGAFFVGAR